MTDTQDKALARLLAAAKTLPPEEQAAYLRDACASDDALYQSAVAAMQSRQHWIDSDNEAEVGADGAGSVAPGDVIGSYRVLRSLGQGGMGEVFLAERADDQFRQQVAIKLVRRGVLSRQAHGRLRQERQILATLEHPNIARLLDGGTTDGIPYIVMEYVEGVPIDTYCDSHALTIEQRLRLCLVVCSAVHRAHQSLIVHRDLKPSNILVTPAGVPKLLDFGIAKLLDDRQTTHTMAVTQADIRVMTPDHASPEQITGDVITTSSDIYVLGVLLYELLCGRKPFELRSNRLAELERAICEDTPPSMSAALLAAGHASPQALSKIAAERSVSVAKLRRQLSGDLDNIVMMAMRKEPERRYSSAEQLAGDIERFLDNKPIVARPDAWAYRTGKFVRRHAVVVGLSSVLLTLLVGFSVTTYLQARRIAHERDIAQIERERAEAVSIFLVDSFTEVDPSHARGKEITAREILDTGAIRVAKDLRNQPALQATLLDTIGTVYLGLGQYGEAKQLAEHGLALRRSLAPDGNLDVAKSLYSLNQVYEKQGDLDKAEALARENLAITRKAVGERSIETAQSICRLGVIVRKKGELDAAAELLNDCLARLTELRGPKVGLLTIPLENLAGIARDRNDFAQAEKLFEQCLDIDRSSLGEDHPQYIQHLMHLASVKVDRGDSQAAERIFHKALQLYERVLGPEHPETITAKSEFALFLMDGGRLSEAEQLFLTILDTNRKRYGPHHYLVGNDLERLGRVLFKESRFAEAESRFDEALTIYRAELPAGHGYTASTLSMLGRTQIERDRPKEAEASLRLALQSWKVNYGEASTGYAVAQAALGKALLMQERYPEAEAALTHSYPILYRTLRGGPGADIPTQVAEWIGALYRDMGHPEIGEKYLAQFAVAR